MRAIAEGARLYRKRSSDAVLQVEQGSLYPALHRLLKRGWIEFDHGTSENNRRAKCYALTKKGRMPHARPRGRPIPALTSRGEPPHSRASRLLRHATGAG